MVQCLLSKAPSKKVHYHSPSQNQLAYLINAVVSSGNGCRKMHTQLNLLAKRTRMVSKLVSSSPSEFTTCNIYYTMYFTLSYDANLMYFVYLSNLITSDSNLTLILYLSGERVHAISEQWHHTHEDNCWVVDESDILKLMPQM